MVKQSRTHGAWLPAPFIGEEAMVIALERVYQALHPGDWLIVGLYPSPPDELGQILTKLRIVRSGGRPWMATEIEERLRTLAFESIETFSPMPPGSICAWPAGRWGEVNLASRVR